MAFSTGRNRESRSQSRWDDEPWIIRWRVRGRLHKDHDQVTSSFKPEVLLKTFSDTSCLFLRFGTATRWRTSSWVRWFCRARQRTHLTLRLFSWGNRDGSRRTRCPGTSAWRSSPSLSSPPSDPEVGAELWTEHLMSLPETRPVWTWFCRMSSIPLSRI